MRLVPKPLGGNVSPELETELMGSQSFTACLSVFARVGMLQGADLAPAAEVTLARVATKRGDPYCPDSTRWGRRRPEEVGPPHRRQGLVPALIGPRGTRRSARKC